MLARPSSSSYVLVDDVCSRPRAVEELGFVDRDSVVDRLRPEELQAAEGFFRLRDEALRVGPLRHVALNGDGFKTTYHRFSYTLRATGHENTLAFELIAKNDKRIAVGHILPQEIVIREMFEPSGRAG
jgi:hypothetical protein